MLQSVDRASTLLGFALACTLLTLASAPAAAQEPDAFTGHWEGEIEVPGTPLRVKVDLEAGEEGNGLSGTIDIPVQGAMGVPLRDFEVEGSSIRFTIAGIPGEPTFDGTLTGDRIEGDFTQGGGELTFWLGREELAGMARPQEPKPPFPYVEEEVTYTGGTSEEGEVTLAGTLTIPEGDGPFPAALLITGSGPQDRDEALMGHRPFLVLADHLTRRGIAVLRADDRGVGGSTGGSVMQSTSRDFAEDAVAGIELLSEDERIGAVGVIGHSEGGLVGPLAATLSDDISYVVMLAGTGVPGTEILNLQLELISRAQGLDEEAIAEQLELQGQALETVMSDATREEKAEKLRGIVDRQLALNPTMEEAEDADRETAAQAAMSSVLNPWFEFFLEFDPRPVLREVDVPVLAMNGGVDLQVDADQNLPEIARALLEGGNTDVCVRRFPKLNHLFQTAETGSPMEYGSIEETFAPAALETISEWILARFG